jgi:hypothetical protein
MADEPAYKICEICHKRMVYAPILGGVICINADCEASPYNSDRQRTGMFGPIEPRKIHTEINREQEAWARNGKNLPTYVHIFNASNKALCGTRIDNHPECDDQSEDYANWPVPVDGYCPGCFRPVCPDCAMLDSEF